MVWLVAGPPTKIKSNSEDIQLSCSLNHTDEEGPFTHLREIMLHSLSKKNTQSKKEFPHPVLSDEIIIQWRADMLVRKTDMMLS